MQPLLTWQEWLRIPMSKEIACTRYEKDIGDSHVFYYSVITAAEESVVALIALALYLFGGKQISDTAYVLICILSAVSLALWHLRRKILRQSAQLTQPIRSL